jgi:peptidylprolyl isomerase
MQTVQQGDRVRVHYVKRFQDGSVVSSSGRGPVELTVGTDHPRLPGLGLTLVGLAPGARATISVPPALAYGASDPARVRRLARSRFPGDTALEAGGRVCLADRRGRRRLVRVVAVRGDVVVVDTNHRWAGQAMELEVQLVSIQAPDASTGARAF